MAGDGKNLLDVVDKMVSTLDLDLDPKQRQSKSCLPFTIMALEGKGTVLHFLLVDMDGAPDSLERSRFGVVSEKGWILVYDTMFSHIVWQQRIDTDKMNWADLLKQYRTEAEDGKSQSTLLVHSRLSGLHFLQQEVNIAHDLHPMSEPNEGKLKPTPIIYEAHAAFCKPILCSDGDTILPVEMDKLGLTNERHPETVFKIHTFPATIMSIKEVGQVETSKQILVTTEDGSVNLLEVKWNLEENLVTATLLSSFILPTYDLEQRPIGICVEGREKIYVIGTTSKYIFLIHLTEEGGMSKLSPLGKKILPTDGVSCLAMREGRGLIAAGCFDGTIRIFSFPEMSRISTINYHNSQINALMFVNEMRNKTGRRYLLSSAKEPGIAVWTIPNCKAT